jgi:tetraacyldisaccharide 4'-kinase
LLPNAAHPAHHEQLSTLISHCFNGSNPAHSLPCEDNSMSLRNPLTRLARHLWYGKKNANPLLVPLEKLFREGVALRHEAYQTGRISTGRLAVPVMVVGNITVGGTGKTPLTIWLAQFLKARGYRPGIISRGYGGLVQRRPMAVSFDTDARVAGDEPVMMARRTGCPVYVFPKRVEAGHALLANTDCNIIIADDGLQHYDLARDIEIAVIDGERGFGNGHLLPAGPMREPIERLETVDLVVHTGTAPEGGIVMTLEGTLATSLRDVCKRRPLSSFIGEPLHAMAGIGHPDRFFDHLRAQGLTFTERAFADHHAYTARDLTFSGNAPLLMTEKDAVKCRRFARDNDWYLPIHAHLPLAFGVDLLTLLKTKAHG